MRSSYSPPQRLNRVPSPQFLCEHRLDPSPTSVPAHLLPHTFRLPPTARFGVLRPRTLLAYKCHCSHLASFLLNVSLPATLPVPPLYTVMYAAYLATSHAPDTIRAMLAAVGWLHK